MYHFFRKWAQYNKYMLSTLWLLMTWCFSTNTSSHRADYIFHVFPTVCGLNHISFRQSVIFCLIYLHWIIYDTSEWPKFWNALSWNCLLKWCPFWSGLSVLMNDDLLFQAKSDFSSCCCHLYGVTGIRNKEMSERWVLWRGHKILTHWGLVMPYGDIDLGQHWLRWWLLAWRHQSITWTILTYHKYGPVTLIWGQFHKRYLSHWPPKSAWKFTLNLPGANELTLLPGSNCIGVHLWTRFSGQHMDLLMTKQHWFR